MRASKLKNIVILVLAVVDLFLLALVIPRAAEESRADKAASRQILSLLAENDIAMPSGAVSSKNGALAPVTAPRDIEAETRAAELLLGGEAWESDLGGGIRIYSAPSGQAEFRASGEFRAELAVPPTGVLGYPDKAARLLKKLGVEAGELTRETVDGKTVVTAAQLLRGTEVWGAEVTLVYGSGGLESISGRWYQDGGLEYGQGRRLSSATALLRFINSRDELGYVCAAVTDMRAVYVPASGTDNRLEPAWLITTDTGVFLVDFASETVSRG